MNDTSIGLVLTSLEGDVIQQSIRYSFKATNNEVEYEALIAGLSLTEEPSIHKLDDHSNSQLVVNQLLGTHQARDSKMIAYLTHVKEL